MPEYPPRPPGSENNSNNSNQIYPPVAPPGTGTENEQNRFAESISQEKLKELYELQLKNELGQLSDKEYEEAVEEINKKFLKIQKYWQKRGVTIPNIGVNDVPIFEVTDTDIKKFIQSTCSITEERVYQPIKYENRVIFDNRTGERIAGENFKHREKDLYSKDSNGNGIFDKYSLRLGDCVFFIPPEFINVTESSSTIKEPSIRSTSTIKKKYGYSSSDLTIKLAFNGDDQINGFPVDSPFGDKKYYIDGLRSFLAQCRVSPIMYVENEFLNKTCGIYALIVQNIQISTIPNFPRLIECTVMAMEFDCSIYTMCPAWEYGNLIEWDLYRYNYQRLLQDTPLIDKSISSPVNSLYMMKNVKSFIMDDTFSVYIPEEVGLLGITEDTSDDFVLDIKKIKYEKILNNKEDEFTISAMNFGFENIIVTPKLSNFNKPTAQYLGGGDGYVSIVVTTTNKYTASQFKSLIAKSQYIIKKIKDCSGIGFVKIKNDFLELIGSEYLLIDSVSVDTVPNFPGLFSINIQASTNDMYSSSIEELKPFRPFSKEKGDASDCIHQDFEGLFTKACQDVYSEYKLGEYDLYPDLSLPNYGEINVAIKAINEWRKRVGLVAIPFEIYPKKVSTNTIFDLPYGMNKFLDPDYYFMYPHLDFMNLNVKVEDLTSTKVECSNIDKVYKNDFTQTLQSGGSSNGGSSDPNNNTLMNAPGDKATSCRELNIKCAREIDRVFLDFLLAKCGCAYVFGANGQYVYAKSDPRWTQENENRLQAHGGPVLDKWRKGIQAFDCSGFVGYGMYRVGYFNTVPRQRHDVFHSYCTPISKSELRPGDFVTNSGHIAVYIGSGKTVEAMGKDHGVKIGNLGNRFTWYGRCKWTPSLLAQHSSSIGGSAGGNTQIPFALNLINNARIPILNDNVQIPNDQIQNTQKPVIDDIGQNPIPVPGTNGQTDNSRVNLGKYGVVGGKNLDRHDDKIIKWSKNYNLNPNWIKALIRQESCFDEKVYNSYPAVGLMQITKHPCGQYGIPFSIPYLQDPDNNLNIGCRLVSDMFKVFGNYPDAIEGFGQGEYRWKQVKAGAAMKEHEKFHMRKVQEYYDILIENGGTSAGFEGSTTVENERYETVNQTIYVSKKHGNRKEAFSNTGVFGLPIIIESPVNTLFRLTNSHRTKYTKEREEVRDNYLKTTKNCINLKPLKEKIDEQAKLISKILGYELKEISLSIIMGGGAGTGGTSGTGNNGTDGNQNPITGNNPNPNNTPQNLNGTVFTGDYAKMVEKSTDISNKMSLFSALIDESNYGCRGTMLKAFPTFSFTITNDSSQWLDGRKLWNNVFPYKSIMGITITHDFEQPVGTAIIRATNLSQNLNRIPKIDYKSIEDDVNLSKLNKKFYKHFGFIIGTPEATEGMLEAHSNLPKEINVKPGVRVHIRMGYGNNFADLPVVFNGTIAEIGGSDYLEMIAQNDGTELVNTVLSNEQEETNSVGKLNTEPSNMVASLLIDRSSWTHLFSKKWGEMSEYHIEHFGLYTGHNLGGIANNRELEYDLTKNIYLANYSQATYSSISVNNVFDDEEGLDIYLFNRTPWDVANISAQIVPEFVAYPMYHQFDSRLFYGLPSWLCKYRYDVKENGILTEYMKAFSQIHICNMNDIIDNRVKASSKFLTTNAMCSYVLGNEQDDNAKCTPVIFADKSIEWSKQKTKIIDSAILQNYFGPDSIWEFFGFNRGVTNAESVAVTYLLDSFSKIYYDELIMIGNPTIKPYDNIFVDDPFGEMYGLARANRVTHSFTTDTGFTTSVTPGLISYSKSEDSGSTNNWRNIVNFCDLTSTILGGRFESLDIVSNYLPCIYDVSKNSKEEQSSEDIRDFLMKSVVNLEPKINIDAFSNDLKSKAQKIHDNSRKEYIEKFLKHTTYVNEFSAGGLGRDFSKWLSRLPLLRGVSGFFVNGNCIGVRPLLHKNKPFITGIKGSKELIDGYSESPNFTIIEE